MMVLLDPERRLTARTALKKREELCAPDHQRRWLPYLGSRYCNLHACGAGNGSVAVRLRVGLASLTGGRQDVGAAGRHCPPKTS